MNNWVIVYYADCSPLEWYLINHIPFQVPKGTSLEEKREISIEYGIPLAEIEEIGDWRGQIRHDVTERARIKEAHDDRVRCYPSHIEKSAPDTKRDPWWKIW